MSIESEVAPSRTKKFVGVLLMALGVCTGAAIAQQQPAPSQPPAPQPAAASDNRRPSLNFSAVIRGWIRADSIQSDENPGIAIKAPTMNKGFGVAGTRNFGNVFGFTIDYSGHLINDMPASRPSWPVRR